MRKVILFLAIALLAGCSDELLTTSDPNQPLLDADQVTLAVNAPVIYDGAWEGGEAELRLYDIYNESGDFAGLNWSVNDSIGIYNYHDLILANGFGSGAFNKINGYAFKFLPTIVITGERNIFRKVNLGPPYPDKFEPGWYMAYYPFTTIDLGNTVTKPYAPGGNMVFPMPLVQRQVESGKYNVQEYATMHSQKLDFATYAASSPINSVGFETPIQWMHNQSYLEFNTPKSDDPDLRIIQVTVEAEKPIFNTSVEATPAGATFFPAAPADVTEKLVLWFGEDKYDDPDKFGVKADKEFTAWLFAAINPGVNAATTLTFTLRTTKGNFTAKVKSPATIIPGYRYKIDLKWGDLVEGNVWPSNDCGEMPLISVDAAGKQHVYIFNACELAWVSWYSNGMVADVPGLPHNFVDVTIHLLSSLDLDNHEWLPISAAHVLPFAGTFEGNGMSISNMMCNPAVPAVPGNWVDRYGTSDPMWHSPFRYGGFVGMNNGTINKVTLENVTVDIDESVSGAPFEMNLAGGIAGANTGVIEDCRIVGDNLIKATKNVSTVFVGGIVGENQTGGEVNNCFFGDARFASKIEGCFAGGIVGVNRNVVSEATIISSIIDGVCAGGIVATNSPAAATITNGAMSGSFVFGTTFAGGIAGTNYGVTDACAIPGNAIIKATATTSNAGGIVGRNNGEVTNCDVPIQAVEIEGSNAGGIVGLNNDAAATVLNCSFNGQSVTTTVNGGGIVGNNIGIVELCTAKGGEVTSTETASVCGGIAGLSTSTGRVKACTNAGTTVAGNNTVGGIVGDNAGDIGVCLFEDVALSASASGAAVGGIAGRNSGKIGSCVSYHTPIAASGPKGNIVGNNGGGPGDVSNCAINPDGATVVGSGVATQQTEYFLGTWTVALDNVLNSVEPKIILLRQNAAGPAGIWKWDATFNYVFTAY